MDGLKVKNVTAVNRKDVPVIGTFSSARFVQAYVDHLVRSGSPTTLTVGGVVLSASDVQTSLRDAINNTHHDLVVDPNLVEDRAQIDATAHPVEYAVFHNKFGLLDGNSYSFLVNNLGVAVNGFPNIPDGVTRIPSRNIVFKNVKVKDQQAFINEVIAINAGGTAVIDPVGAVFQIRNPHPDTGVPITISHTDDAQARYAGNPVANAQALVAKAAALGEFESTHLDVTRSNMPASVLQWVEQQSGSETLADIGVNYYCNGDSMFHVNKGVIAFKVDAAENVTMKKTSVNGLVNLGVEGSTVCGNYLEGFSHPLANLYGYGGSAVRGYTFAGSTNVLVKESEAHNLSAVQGPAIGFEVMTDSADVRFIKSVVRDVVAGWGDPMGPYGSTESAKAVGFRVSATAGPVTIDRGCATGLSGVGGSWFLYDDSGSVVASKTCEPSS